MKSSKKLKQIGPGIVIAATGLGAGDMIAATVAGAKYGMVLLWSIILGAVLKYVLNEGLARWQLSERTSLLHAWKKHLHKSVSIYFIIYLFLWAFIVSGALMAACGLAAHSLVPELSIPVWGILHAVVAIVLVWYIDYRYFENLMKLFIGLMFLVVIVSAAMIQTDWQTILYGLIHPEIPKGSAKFILGVIGGVGGSVTLLSYGYWIREKGWKTSKDLPAVRIDLIVAYSLTCIFGIAILIISSDLKPEMVTGSKIVIALADRMGDVTGEAGKYIFLIGFWGAVFSSLLGVFHGVPYLYDDFVSKKKNKNLTQERSRNYKFFLIYLASLPMLLLFVNKPVWIIIIYSITGAFFMPLLAGVLFYLNNKLIRIKNRNKWGINLMLIVCLILFAYLAINELIGFL